jgi:hypothetical protein
MATFKKKEIVELVGGDIFADGNDRNVVSNSEIETGPVDKPFNDDSEYEKGMPTTSDKVFGRYRQNIPWFAVYSFGGTRAGGSQTINVAESKNTIIKKKHVEEKIEDLVKKNKNNYEVTDKNYNPKVEKLMDTINDVDLTDSQLEELTKAIMAKKNNTNKTKNL